MFLPSVASTVTEREGPNVEVLEVSGESGDDELTSVVAPAADICRSEGSQVGVR